MSISIDKILDEFKDINYAYNDSSKFDTLKQMLNEAVEVVRCKECRYGHLCVFGQHLGLDGFCSKGERKEQA